MSARFSSAFWSHYEVQRDVKQAIIRLKNPNVSETKQKYYQINYLVHSLKEHVHRWAQEHQKARKTTEIWWMTEEFFQKTSSQ